MKNERIVHLLLIVLSVSLLNSSASGTIMGRICSESFNGKLRLFQLAKNRAHYGYAIWMKEDNTGLLLDYQLKGGSNSESPYDNFNRRFGVENLPITTSAGFSQGGYDKPQGIAISQGEVVNRLFSEEMDAIVVLEDGQIDVYNATERAHYASVAKSGRMTDYAFRGEFFRKAQKEGWTVFQTHLLAKNNALTISSAARKKPATRKVLTRVKNVAGERQLIIFYVDSGDYLYDMTRGLYDYLRANDYTIDFMINLDTGANDVLETHASINACRSGRPEGFSSAKTSSNLLAFYFK